MTIKERGADTPFERAQAFRDLVREMVPPEGDANLAILDLLGLTQIAARQPRPVRRKLAAQAFGQTLDTFQKRYELLLLRDVAEMIWGVEQKARESSAC